MKLFDGPVYSPGVTPEIIQAIIEQYIPCSFKRAGEGVYASELVGCGRSASYFFIPFHLDIPRARAEKATLRASCPMHRHADSVIEYGEYIRTTRAEYFHWKTGLSLNDQEFIVWEVLTS